MSAETQAILAQYKKLLADAREEIERLRTFADRETDRLRDALRRLDEQDDEPELPRKGAD
jgi:F0F1-type ATP synthase membrane subunit b/b'